MHCTHSQFCLFVVKQKHHSLKALISMSLEHLIRFIKFSAKVVLINSKRVLHEPADQSGIVASQSLIIAIGRSQTIIFEALKTFFTVIS